MVRYFYELKREESIEHGLKLTNFLTKLTEFLVKMVGKISIFTVGYFYELKQVESIEHGLKLTIFSTKTRQFSVQMAGKMFHFHASPFSSEWGKNGFRFNTVLKRRQFSPEIHLENA